MKATLPIITLYKALSKYSQNGYSQRCYSLNGVYASQRCYSLISDLHLEFNSISIQMPKSNLISKSNLIPKSNLILAGDIGYPSYKSYNEFLYNCSKLYQNIYLITGNHEYYESLKTNQTMNEINIEIQSICDKINLTKSETCGHIYFLDNKMIYDNFTNTYIIGSTLWTHINEENKSSSSYSNDYNYIKDLTVDKTNEMFNTNYNFIKSSIDIVKLHKQIKPSIKCIIITHHMPSYKLIHPKYKHMTHITPFFATNCDVLIGEPVDYWIYGHTHTASKHQINNTILISNPKGYAKQQSGYDPNLNIQI
jgi:predicted phosphodiesterase